MNRRTILLSAVILLAVSAAAQNDWIKTGTGLGVDKPRVAVPDFKMGNADPATGSLQKVYDDTLFNDLSQSGILEVVSKSLYPLQQPGAPEDVKLDAWSNDPTKASMLA